MAPEREQLGRAESTVASTASALKVAKAYRRGNCLPEIMSENEIMNDKLEAYMREFCRFLSSRPIPKYGFNDDFTPLTEDNKKILMPNVLSQYIGQHLLQIRSQFPDHPDFANLKSDEHPSWWTNLRAQFLKECERYHFNLGTDYEYGLKSIKPLYYETGFDSIPANEEHIEDYISAISLKNILRKVINSAGAFAEMNRKADHGPFQKRLMLVMTASCIGRGGEIKFQRYDRWNFEHKYQMLDIAWYEEKTLRTHRMPCPPDMRYLMCILHSLGCYWAIEDGLYRSADAIKKGNEKAVFPCLYETANNYVSTKISNIIKDNLPAGTPDNIKKLFSAKSLRIGGVSTLIHHPEMTTLQACARSGHATGTTLERYFDEASIMRGIPAALAMHGYKSLKAEVKMYRLSCLGDSLQSSTDKLVKNLFRISIPEFQEGGALRIVVKVAAAAMIAHYNQVQADFGPDNAICSCLEKAARNANIKDPQLPNASPELVLAKWSEIVLDDFKEQNLQFAKTTVEMASLAQGQNEMKRALLKVLDKVDSMMVSQKDLQAQLATKTAHINQLQSKVHHLEQANHKLKRLHIPEKLAMLKTPERPKKRYCVATDNDIRQYSVVVLDNDDDEEEKDDKRLEKTAASYYVDQRQGDDDEEEEEDKRLKKTAASYVDQRQGKGGVCRTYGLILQLISDKDLKTTKLQDSKVDCLQKEKDKARYCLELVDYVISKEEREKLASFMKEGRKLDQNIQDLAHSLETRACEKMIEFEGEDPNGLNKKTKSYSALGQRVVKYKKKICLEVKKEKSAVGWQNCELMEREAMVAASKDQSNPHVVIPVAGRIKTFLE